MFGASFIVITYRRGMPEIGYSILWGEEAVNQRESGLKLMCEFILNILPTGMTFIDKLDQRGF